MGTGKSREPDALFLLTNGNTVMTSYNVYLQFFGNGWKDKNYKNIMAMDSTDAITQAKTKCSSKYGVSFDSIQVSMFWHNWA